MKCQFCDDATITLPANKGDEHLIVTLQGNSIHVHGPLNDYDLLHKFIIAIIKESKFSNNELIKLIDDLSKTCKI